ncbi:PspC domain-containing protein [Natronosporangium hydrolyticum]|uniref:PspC domain-containing protein n=1 Tax=Natronosporangium hydrolyticum TaxID=2811111 RepID=A0A895YMB2_9ACTN|nr:PspC domain-containing protein [Natronosporangium hydrolyticum]
MYRSREHRLAAGVAAGIAAHLGLPVLAVRAVFVGLLGFNGLGVLLYAIFWAVLPVDPAGGPDRAESRRVLPLLGFAGLALVVLVFRALTVDDQPATAALGWLTALIAVGAGIIWHQTSGAATTRRPAGSGPELGNGAGGNAWLGAVLTETGRRAYLLRFIGGGGLIAVGMIGLVAFFAPVGGGIAATMNGLLFALLALSGVALVSAPLLWRIFGALREEREARIREQERAEFAAMVHDEVLHTLALIQRNAESGSTVYRLARAQERTLRNWLYKPTGSPSERLSAALEQAAGEVEDAYGITVEVVLVGSDAEVGVGDRVQALVAAAREALVNAGRHAQVATVSLYAEVEPDQVNVFVRDRGVGFDPTQINGGRHGVRGSIVGRMERHGGSAKIISSAGEGTEVRLWLPLRATPATATTGTAAADPEEGTA